MRFLYFIFSILIFYACSLKEDRRKEQEKTVFRYNEPAGITTLDPAYVRRFEDFLVVEQLYNGLVSLDEDMHVVPAIAKSWEVSDDGLTYTFFLRDDVYFNQSELFGEEKTKRVTATDFVYSFLRIIDPVTASPGKYIFQNVAPNSKTIKGVEAKDEFTLVIHMREPQPSFIFQLSLPYCKVVPHEVVEHYGDNFGQHPIGTGAFYLKRWKKDVKMILAKNPNYFETDEQGVRLPYLDAVSVYFLKDKHQEFVKLKSRNLEMISGLNEQDKDELLTEDGVLVKALQNDFKLLKNDWLNTEYLGILVDKEIQQSPLKDKRVRQAIGYALNRQEMIRYLRNNIGTPATKGFVPKGMPFFDKYAIDGFAYHPQKAVELLRQAGFDSEHPLTGITLSATAEYRTMCEYLQRELLKVGIEIKVDISPVGAINQRIAQFEAQFYRKSWIADYPDAINYFQLFYSKNFYPENGSNYTHFFNPEYDALYEIALREKDFDSRMNLYKKMNQIIHNEAPVIPLFYAETLRFIKKNVQGLKSNALNMLSLKQVRVDRN